MKGFDYFLHAKLPLPLVARKSKWPQLPSPPSLLLYKTKESLFISRASNWRGQLKGVIAVRSTISSPLRVCWRRHCLLLSHYTGRQAGTTNGNRPRASICRSLNRLQIIFHRRCRCSPRARRVLLRLLFLSIHLSPSDSQPARLNSVQ